MSDLALFFALLGVVIAVVEGVASDLAFFFALLGVVIAVVEEVAEWLRDRRD